MFSYGEDVHPHAGLDSLTINKECNLSYYFSPGTEGFLFHRGKFIKGSYNDGLVIYRDLPTYSEQDPGEYVFSYPVNTTLAFVASLSDNYPVVPVYSDTGFLTAEAVDTDGDGVDEYVRVCGGSTDLVGMKTNFNISIFSCNSGNTPTLVNTLLVQLSGIIDNGDYISPYRRTFRWGDFLGNGKAQLLPRRVRAAPGLSR